MAVEEGECIIPGMSAVVGACSEDDDDSGGEE